MKRTEQQARTCSIDDCDSRHYGRGWCKRHYLRWYKHGDPSHQRPGPATYSGVHDRMNQTDPASNHPCSECGTTTQRREWAYEHTDIDEMVDPATGFPFSTNPAHYRPLCVSCHRRLDRNRQHAA